MTELERLKKEVEYWREQTAAMMTYLAICKEERDTAREQVRLLKDDKPAPGVCPRCRGQKQIDHGPSTWNCPTCGGTGTWRCPACGGDK